MPRLKAANNAKTTLSQDINATATSFNVADGTLFPDAPFLASVDDEIMEIGAKSVNTFSSVLRGQEGTTAASHLSGANVGNRFTAGTLAELADQADVSNLAGVGRTIETVKGIADALTSHLSDYVLQVPYGVATGSANTYAVTLNPAPSAYVDGMAIAVKINVNNTGASTININGLGAKTIKKPNGNDVSAGNLKAGSIYSMRYNGTNFILQGSDAAGDATPGDVISGKTFSNDGGEQTGTLELTGDAVAANVLSGKTFYNTNAKTKVTGTMTNRGAVTITPGATNKAIAEGYHNGSGQVAAVIVLENSEASDTLKISADTQRDTNQTTYTLLKNIKVARKGSIRVKFDTYCNFMGQWPGKAQIHKNGQPFGTERNVIQTWTTYSEDLNVDANDQIQIYARNALDTSYQTSVKNFRIYYDIVQTTVSPQDSVITN